MTFRVGQKVVCIRASLGLERGRIYTVRWIGKRSTDIGVGIMVEERVEMHPSGVEWSFSVARFRPVVEHKTDISIFTKMLTGKRVDA